MVVDCYLSPFLIVVVYKIRNWQIVVICSNLFYENLVVYKQGRRPSGGQEDRKGGRSKVGYSEVIQTIGKAMGTFPFSNDFFHGLLL